MCFSANASFGSAALLIAVGTVTFTENRSKPHRMLTAVPLFFGIQQASEGIVWLTMGQNTTQALHQFGVLSFLGFALVVWPSWVPWAIFNIEPNERRKKLLQIIGIIGLCASTAATWILLTTDAKAYITGHSMGYSLDNMQRYWSPNIEFLAYFIPTVLPFFISSLKIVKMAGYMIISSMLLTQLINKEASTSVWCFFASMISLYIAVYILSFRKDVIA